MKHKAMRNAKRPTENWQLSLGPVLKYNIIFCVMIMLIIIMFSVFFLIHRTKTAAQSALDIAASQLSHRVTESISLLQSLAALPEYNDSTLDPYVKADKLNQMGPYFGYMMIRYVDQDISVYRTGKQPASLASREYMQRLFSTRQAQVTDSFPAGADGKTLNYTVAVPLIDAQDKITGCLFCAIYFDEVVELLDGVRENPETDALLLGSEGQVMSSTAGDHDYGNIYLDGLREKHVMGVTPDQLETNLLSGVSGSYWAYSGDGIYYVTYRRVENTSWNILCRSSLGAAFLSIWPGLLFLLTVIFGLGTILLLAVNHYVKTQRKVIDSLTQSVGELEKRIYQDDRPDDVTFKDIIRLTSDGLSDSLTGVVTRTVFLNQANLQIKKAREGKLIALCFVDMDNLKYLNDTYGHNAGDAALKSVGYVLREYEKKFEGVVGRHGGDEFVLLLTDLSNQEELTEMLEELMLRLQVDFVFNSSRVSTQCSVGVAIRKHGETVEQLITNADEALYFVKQNGKGYYKICRN